MVLGPVENLLHLVPVINIFKLQQFNRCAGNNHPVVFFIFQVVEIPVKLFHVLRWRIFWFVPFYFHEIDFNLQRRIG